MVKRVLFIAVILAVLLSTFLPQVAMAQTVVVSGVDVNSYHMPYPFETRVFATESRQWVVYNQGTKYKSSTDLTGTSWSPEYSIPITAGAYGGYDIAFDGTLVHIVTCPQRYVKYIGGTPDDDTGIITWGTQTTIFSDAYNSESSPTIAVDNSGYKHIVWSDYHYQQYHHHLFHTKSTTANDTTFIKAYTKTISGISTGTYSSITELHAMATGGRLALVAVTGDKVVVQRFTGTDWTTNAVTASDIQDNLCWSSVVEDDYVHVSFLEETTNDIIYNKWSYSTNLFSGEVTIKEGCSATTGPAITRITTDNTLIIFYETNPPTNDHIYYAVYDVGEATWTYDYDWVNDIDGLPSNYGYLLSAPEAVTDDQIGLVYGAGASNNILKYKQLVLPWEVETLDPTGVTDDQATLRGNIKGVGSGATTIRGFYYGETNPPAIWIGEAGEFNVGVYSQTVTGLEADTIYFCQAHLADEYSNEANGEIITFMTDQPVYVDEDEVPDGLAPPLPDEPSGWVGPPKDWGNFNGIPWTFIAFLLITGGMVLIGLLATKLGRGSVIILFAVLGFLLGVLCFFPKGGYLDWWVMLPYFIVGWALIKRDKESPIG